MKRLVAVAVVVVAAFSIVGTAPAQTGNATIDGNTHPNVGALLRMRADGSLTITCSGTLIAPRVFLTAGHCAAALYSRGQHQAYVTFDPFFGTDATRGYQIFSTPYHGAVINNPDWRAPYQNDTAIVYLDAPERARRHRQRAELPRALPELIDRGTGGGIGSRPCPCSSRVGC